MSWRRFSPGDTAQQPWPIASRRFRKGRSPARFSFGDCFAYALAKQIGEPLLFKGNALSHTDIVRA